MNTGSGLRIAAKRLSITNKKSYIHPTAIVEDPDSVGSGTSIWHYCHVVAGARIGLGCTLGQNTFVAGTAVIGNGVKVQNNVSVYDGVVLEDEVFCGPSCVFTNVKNPRSAVPRQGEFLTTVIKRGATIGANATVLAGVTVGPFAMVGAGCVVTKDVDPYRVITGNPGVARGFACQCGESLPREDTGSELRCPRCSCRFELSNGRLNLVIP